MKHVASISTRLSLAVLFFVVSAQAESGQRVTAYIPFEFTIASRSLPAGRYEFIRTDDDIYQVRDADCRSLFARASTSIQGNGVSEKSMLKFATVDGHQVLVQIWNELADNGSEFHDGQSHVELATQPTVHGVAGRR
jgi:hypothetical protein